MEGQRSLRPREYLAHEAKSLLARLDQVKPIALHETMVPAAAASPEARAAIETLLMRGRRALTADVTRFLDRLDAPGDVESLGRAFVMLRLRFHAALSRFDIFAQALTQRSEHETGVWLAGLDALAEDGLSVEGGYFEPPPVICYLERGLGAAIRRARTRLPGGDPNPVAIIRVPRERMVGSGIGASMLHEVGHQAAALLGLVPSLRRALQERAARGGGDQARFQTWSRWISEIVADLWAVGSIGVGATLGLMSVVTLPRPFTLRANDDDPHPTPWVRVMLSCAMGEALFPDGQWGRLRALWKGFYPPEPLEKKGGERIDELLRTMPELVSILLDHRPESLGGASLREVLPGRRRTPARLRALGKRWIKRPASLARARPGLVFAIIGQARADGAVGAEEEHGTLARLLSTWALQRAVSGAKACGEGRRGQLKRWRMEEIHE